MQYLANFGAIDMRSLSGWYIKIYGVKGCFFDIIKIGPVRIKLQFIAAWASSHGYGFYSSQWCTAMVYWYR